ncbi:MAG: hypothetical protein ACOCPZ_01590, partial [Natrialbaceae archaeon]
GMRDELGLQPLTVYVPVGDGVRGFIPRRRAFELPENPNHVFATGPSVSRGVSFAPTGGRLTSESERIRRTRPPTTAVEAAEQLGNTLVEHFEIVDSVTVEHTGESSELTVAVDDPAFGPVARVDHPAVSTLACGVARATDEPVAVEPIDDTTVVLETELGSPDESS